MEMSYEEFMKDYKMKHEVCPKCGTKSHMTTLAGYFLDLSKPDDYKDLNKCTCSNCDDEHTCHERVSSEEFKNKEK